ncbi:hypothetical protein C9994_06510 [Marivirga lumbricoides]|uniref:Uncharacterized protein n=1 Tax=Marivirga lumbricoides TaxID=1046115 RepID=A0A2T4DS54_9BACT|nr:hypothetical protein C9994_06510 [Marivirga lumbricoides]
MTKAVTPINGAILQIPLIKKLGYAYAKYINLLKIASSPDLPDLIKVFDYKTETEEYNLQELEAQDYLIAPLLVSGLPPTIRKGLWRILDDKATNEDTTVPHFSRHEDWVSDDDWYYCLDADSTKKN